jgi:hypothetical protein
MPGAFTFRSSSARGSIANLDMQVDDAPDLVAEEGPLTAPKVVTPLLQTAPTL